MHSGIFLTWDIEILTDVKSSQFTLLVGHRAHTLPPCRREVPEVPLLCPPGAYWFACLRTVASPCSCCTQRTRVTSHICTQEHTTTKRKRNQSFAKSSVTTDIPSNKRKYPFNMCKKHCVRGYFRLLPRQAGFINIVINSKQQYENYCTMQT